MDRKHARSGINSGLAAVIILYAWFGTAAGALAEDQAPATGVPAADAASGTVTEAELGYFFGYSFGNMLKQGGTREIDFEAVKGGMTDALAGVLPGLSETRQKEIIEAIKTRQEQQQGQATARAGAEASSYMITNARKPGVKTTGSGLHYEVLREGAGESPAATDTVVVHYEGKLVTGKIFDSSVARNEKAEFRLNQVIPGWTEGLQLMKPGGKMRLVVPPALGYGPGGTRNIPPNAVLIFEIELFEVKSEPTG